MAINNIIIIVIQKHFVEIYEQFYLSLDLHVSLLFPRDPSLFLQGFTTITYTFDPLDIYPFYKSLTSRNTV